MNPSLLVRGCQHKFPKIKEQTRSCWPGEICLIWFQQNIRMESDSTWVLPALSCGEDKASDPLQK